jgi:PhnB protein
MARRDGFSTITPYLIFDDAPAAFDYYKRVLGAVEISLTHDPQGGFRHGELRIGDSPVMLCNAKPEFPFMKSASTYGGSPIHLFVYCDDADAMFRQILESGGAVVTEMAGQDYGRSGGVTDPFGVTWWITTHNA